MVGLIEQITSLGWGNVLLCFVLFVCVIVAAVSGYHKFLAVFGLRSAKSIRDEKIDNRLNDMQKQVDEMKGKFEEYKITILNKQEEYHEQSIRIRDNLKDGQDGLRGDIFALKEMLQQFADEENKNTVAMMRSSLWRLHKDFMTQGFVTPDGLKTFMEMGGRYEHSGGNDIYHDKLLPEVEGLEIRYPSGSIYNPERKDESSS